MGFYKHGGKLNMKTFPFTGACFPFVAQYVKEENTFNSY